MSGHRNGFTVWSVESIDLRFVCLIAKLLLGFPWHGRQLFRCWHTWPVFHSNTFHIYLCIEEARGPICKAALCRAGKSCKRNLWICKWPAAPQLHNFLAQPIAIASSVGSFLAPCVCRGSTITRKKCSPSLNSFAYSNENDQQSFLFTKKMLRDVAREWEPIFTAWPYLILSIDSENLYANVQACSVCCTSFPYKNYEIYLVKACKKSPT